MAKASNDKSMQQFSFRAPGAGSVQLVGDFTHWQQSPIQLKSKGAGAWSAAVKLSPGTYHYRFLVDGEWRDDPECTIRVPNAFGTQNAVRRVE